MNKSFASAIALILLSLPQSAWSQTSPPAPAAPAAVTTTTPTSDGFELKDLAHGFVFTAPNSAWSINASQYAVSLTHGTYYDAYITIKKSWYNVTSVQEAYDKRKDSLKSYLPGAEYLRDAESLSVGNESALSMTYKDPAQQKISREIVFLHRGVPYELSFTVKEENFAKVKDDFAAILRGIQAL